MQFQADSSLSANSSLWAREHVSYISQGPEADEAWSSFIFDNSQSFTAPDVERLNDSILSYVQAILGAQAQTCTSILGSGTAFDAQNQFLANLEDSAIERYQSVLQHASSKVDFAFGTGLYMAPSYMRLHIGYVIGYNNEIMIAPVGQPLGVSLDINSTPMPAPVETRETGLVEAPTPKHSVSVSQHTPITAAPAPPSNPPEQTRPPWGQAQDHKDEKTALVATRIT